MLERQKWALGMAALAYVGTSKAYDGFQKEKAEMGAFFKGLGFKERVGIGLLAFVAAYKGAPAVMKAVSSEDKKKEYMETFERLGVGGGVGAAIYPIVKSMVFGDKSSSQEQTRDSTQQPAQALEKKVD